MALTKNERKDPIVDGPLGGLPGGGRTPKALQLKNYEKVLKVIDETAEEAVEVIRGGLRHQDWHIRIKCAELILKKYLPDKKTKEISGKGGKPIEITATNKREVVLSIVDMLDEYETDELREKLDKDGSVRLPGAYARTEDGEEREVEYQAATNTRRKRS